MASSPSSQVKELLGQHNNFYIFVNNLFSENEVVRCRTESLYNTAAEEFPAAFSTKLASTIKKSYHNSQIRIRSAAIFSRFFAKNWPRVPPELQERFKIFFLQLLQEEQEREILKIHCTCVSYVAPLLFPKWPELLTFIFIYLCSTHSRSTKFVSIILLDKLLPQCPLIFEPYDDIMNLVFHRLMDDSSRDPRFRSAAVGAAVKLILYLAKPSSYYEYYGLVPGMLKVLRDTIFYDQDLACSALGEMVVLARENPKFLRVHIESMAEAMLEIASYTSFKEKTRQLAVEFLVTVAESGMGMVLGNVVEELLTELLQMLMCVDETCRREDFDAGKTILSRYAEAALSRLTIALGGDVILSNSPDMLPDFFVDHDWKKRYAAITSLGQIAPGCSQMLVQYLEQSMEKIMELVRDQHPFVRWAAIRVICKFSKCLSPYFQQQFHQQIIPALSEAMDDFENPRVQVHAALALAYSNMKCRSTLKPYLKEIITKLLVFLQEEQTFFKETAMNSFILLAVSAKDDLKPFYGMLMPCLKSLLATAKENSNFMLVAKTLECISVLAVAVGKSVFSADAEEVVKVLISVQQHHSHLGGKDGVTNYLLQTWGRLCTSLGEDFHPYLSACMPMLIELAAQKDYLITDDRNNKHELRMIALTEMLLTCKTLGCIAANIRGGLHLWVEKVLNALLPLVNIKFDEQVRAAAIPVIPYLLQSVAIANGNELPITANTIIPALVKALKESTIKVQVQTLEALRKSIQIADTWAPGDNEIVDSILNVLSQRFHGKAPRESKSKEEEIQDKENLCREARICLHVLIKRFSDQNILLQSDYVKFMWEEDKIPNERRMALNIFTDIATEYREAGLRQYAAHIPFLLKACSDTNPYTQQIVACAIGIYAEFGRETFKHYFQDGLSSLAAIFQKAAFDLEHNMAKDAAVSAYGKVCFFLCEEINSYEGIDSWLFHLPLRCNFDEAKVAHRLLCSMIDKPESKVTGPEDSYICRIITIMAEVLWAGNNIATEETQSKMIQQLKMFKKRLSPDNFVAISKSLPTFLQNALSVYISS